MCLFKVSVELRAHLALHAVRPSVVKLKSFHSEELGLNYLNELLNQQLIDNRLTSQVQIFYFFIYIVFAVSVISNDCVKYIIFSPLN